MDHRFDDDLFEQNLELLRLETEWERLRTAIIDIAKTFDGPNASMDRIPELCEAAAKLNAFESEHPHLISSSPEQHSLEIGVDIGEPGGDTSAVSVVGGSSFDADELDELLREMHLSSLGDRPHSIAAKKLKRLIDLETEENGHK